ncbi:MAG TPA: hypothetical protein VGC15_02835 [Acetobacteraceae bacterium]
MPESTDSSGFWFMDGHITIHLSKATNADGISIVEHLLPGGFGPPLHIHRGEDETFYVLVGGFRFKQGGAADLAARYIFGQDQRWKLAVNVNNLFDRTFVAQCTGAAFCFYGARREVLASLGVRW